MGSQVNINQLKHWYLIHSKPQQEYLAKNNLERQGYEIYVPLAPVHRRRRGRIRTEVGPMFPRYLFIRLNEAVDNWGPIRSTLGVTELVKFGQKPAHVPNNLIDTLKEREDANGIQVLPPKILQKGQKIRILEGPFEGYEGVFEVKSGRERVMILLKILEKQSRLEIEQSQIEVI